MGEIMQEQFYKKIFFTKAVFYVTCIIKFDLNLV